MSIKEKIQADFVTAMKNKNETAKAALSGLKAKITEGEKANKNQELTDAEIVKIITSAIKQRNESADAFTKGNRPELAAKESGEISIISTYLPSQMNESEIESEVRGIIKYFVGLDLPTNVLRGKTQGAFNKYNPGRADPKILQEVINRIIK